MLRVRDIMTREVIRLTPDATIREAMETLSTNHLGGAPVVAGDHVIGVISMTDIIGLIVAGPEPDPAERDGSIDESWEGNDAEPDDDGAPAAEMSEEVWDEWMRGSGARVDDATPEGDKLLDQRTVREAMTEEVFSVPPDASVRTAATMMRDRGIHRVLVMEGKSLVGIVSALDIARAVSDRGTSSEDAALKFRLCRGEPPLWITN